MTKLGANQKGGILGFGGLPASCEAVPKSVLWKADVSSSQIVFMKERRVDRVTQSRVKSSKLILVKCGRVKGNSSLKEETVF